MTDREHAERMAAAIEAVMPRIVDMWGSFEYAEMPGDDEAITELRLAARDFREHQATPPTYEVVRMRSARHVVTCRFLSPCACGAYHTHGLVDPKDVPSHRVAHCLDKLLHPHGYYIIWNGKKER